LFLSKQKLLGLILIVMTMLIVTSTPFQQFASIPNEIRVFEGKSSELSFRTPFMGQLISTDANIVQVSKNDTTRHVQAASGELSTESPLGFSGVKSGTADLQLSIGKIPIKRVKVNVLPETKVFPGGQSIGVKLNSMGVMVVGHHFIHTEEGRVSPGEDASIRVGDLILSMNDTKIKGLDQIGEIVQQAGENGKEIHMEILREKNKLNLVLQPQLDKKDKRYRMGLYIRNSAAGVGTLTFYHPQSSAYGALGHVISDSDTGKPIIAGGGEIMGSIVSSIEKGTQGNPGEKRTIFAEDELLGDIKRNTPFGIFGHMKKRLPNGIMDELVPIGLSEEVQKGPAHILTVLEGNKVERFEIEVVDMVEQKFPTTKGMIIRVTDEELLEKTGGIIQGMSGSPIIQNGKLIGAVTHVFVNDPTSGYGCYIEWMLQDAGIPLKQEERPEAG